MEEIKISKGAGFLKVVGILLVIFGSIAIIMSLILITGAAALIAINLAAGIETNSYEYYAGTIVYTLSSIAELVCGIIGIRNCKKPEKSTKCLVWGIITIVLGIAGSVLMSIAAATKINIINILFVSVCPTLFIIGAILNKKSLSK